MKKTVSILLLVLMVLPIFSQLTSFAAAKVAVSADNVGEVVQGTESVEVPVRISASPRWSAISFNIGFDPDSLHFKGITLNPELRRQAEEGEPNIYAVNDTEAESGNVIVGFAGLMNANGYIGYHPGEYDYFCILTFDVDADAECGDCAVTLDVTSLNGIVSTEIDPTDVPFTVTSGGMTVLCNHDWQLKETVPATCEDDGYESYACSRCTDTKTEVLTKLGHEWGEWVQISSATCTAKAVETRVCIHDASHTETREVGDPDPEAHEWGEWEVTTPAICEEPGTETRICKNDPSHIETREIKPIGHEWGEWQVTTPATCTAKAVETRVCVHDASHTETREVGEPDPDAHEWGEWEVTTPATCEEPGTETRICKNDPSHIETREIKPIGHEWGEWQVTTPATCTAKAVETRVCVHDASHTETREVGEPDPEAHEWGEWEITTPATCEGSGTETRICKNDPSHIETREITPIGHDWGEWEITTPATLHEDGLETRYCLNDREHFETRIIPRTSFVMGDIDRDGEVTVSDALRALRFSVSITVPTDDETVIGDMDRDGSITVTDALAILRLSVGLVSEL